MIIDPRGMSVLDWTAQMAINLDPYGFTGVLDNPLAWKVWARNVVEFPAISLANPPDPDDFTDWREWAIRFCQATENIV